MTYTSPTIVRTLVANNGCYPEDPQMARIYQFRDIGGKTAWAVFAHPSHDDIYQSPYVREAVLLWDRETGLTKEGRAFIQGK